MVRCKFVVDSRKETRHGSVIIELSPVDSKDNEQFWRYTPAGRIEIQTSNLEAAAMFHVGTAYYVDFSPAEKE